MTLHQFSFIFTFQTDVGQRPFIAAPLPVRVIARRHRLSIPMATVVCREAGIGGREAQ